jgi:hypothetical protein
MPLHAPSLTHHLVMVFHLSYAAGDKEILEARNKATLRFACGLPSHREGRAFTAGQTRRKPPQLGIARGIRPKSGADQGSEDALCSGEESRPHEGASATIGSTTDAPSAGSEIEVIGLSAQTKSGTCEPVHICSARFLLDGRRWGISGAQSRAPAGQSISSPTA